MTFFLQAPTDSLAVEVGTAVGGWATTLLLSVLAVINKYVTDGAKWVLSKFSTLPAWSKALVALAFSQVIAFVNAQVGTSASADIGALVTTAQGFLVWGLSMGFHSLVKALFPSKTA